MTTRDQKLTLEVRMTAMEERVKVLEDRVKALDGAPRAGEAVTAARSTLPVTPPKPRAVLKSAASLMPTMVRKPTRPIGR